MPQGYRYEKSQGRFVKKKMEEAFDYDAINQKSAALLISFFRWYPDYYFDVIRSDTADHKLELLQRVILRLFARYSKTHITGCRGGTKTYLLNAEKYHEGTFYPGEKMGYNAPAQKQGANLGSDAYKEIERDYPILTANWKIKNDRDDKFRLVTDFGSEWTMYIPRGSNKHQIGVEEMGQELPEPFDIKTFKTTVNPTLRLKRTVNQVEDKAHINFKRSIITNASDRSNLCFSVYRHGTLMSMLFGEKYEAYCMDFTWKSVLLCNIRDVEYFKDQFKELLPEEQERELCAHYTGITENPMVTDEDLNRSRRQLKCMEDKHCGDENVIYVVSQDVSYEDGKKNAKIGRVVGKLTQYTDIDKRDKYKAQIVFVDGFPPQGTVYQQANELKRCWQKYWINGSEPTYLVIDFQGGYGRAIGEELMKPTTDGSKPLCCYKHLMLTELEQRDALPVIYPMKSGRVGTANPEADMIDYARREFMEGNVELLTADKLGGMEKYKDKHGIKDIDGDRRIISPYIKTQELCDEIKNLQAVNGKEIRRSRAIQRDKWSALKYLLWFKHLLEEQLVVRNHKAKSGWDNLISQFADGKMPTAIPQAQSTRARLIGLRTKR